jgi:hypothetical protein
MAFAQLIKSHKWLSIKEILFTLYPDQIKSVAGFGDVFDQLTKMHPIESEMEIVLSEQVEEDPEDSFVHVSGRKLNYEPGQVPESFGLDFVPWNEWLGMTIEKETLEKYTELEDICHCLYEMTFMGFDEEHIQRELKALTDEVEELTNMSDEERKKNTYSLEDLMKRLNDNKEIKED